VADELGVPGVSAEDLVAVVRVHLDRVHDAVRRLGCGPRAAVDVVETSALDLVAVVAGHPETVEDAVGWWFARASTLGHGAAGAAHDLPRGHGLLAVDAEQARLAEALEELPETQRVPLLLRDSYDLPPASVGAALGVDADAVMEQVAQARLALLPLLDDAGSPPPPAHQDDLGALARLGEGPPVAPRDEQTRRHALSCAACRQVVDAQERARVRLGALTVVALDDDERAAVLLRLEQAAYAALPTRAALVVRGRAQRQAGDGEPGLALSPAVAVLAIALAILLGLGAGLVLSRDRQAVEPVGADGPLPPGVTLVSPPAEPTVTPASPPTVTAPAPQTSVFTVPPPSPPPAPSPAPAPAPTEDLGITLDPPSGPNGQTIAVLGVGWPPGEEVVVDYLDSLGEPTGSRATSVADEQGRFRTELAALDPSNVPGPHAVVALAGDARAEAAYDVQD